MPQQFEYPETGWSTGNMRMARRAMPSDPGYPVRELEGERKRRETKVSKLDKLPVEPTELEHLRAKGGLDYDVIEQKIGKKGMEWIKEWDETLKDANIPPDFRDRWNKSRDYWIQLMQEGIGPSTPTPPKKEKQMPEGYAPEWGRQEI